MFFVITIFLHPSSVLIVCSHTVFSKTDHVDCNEISHAFQRALNSTLQGSVAQSIVSLTMSLRSQLVKFMLTT